MNIRRALHACRGGGRTDADATVCMAGSNSKHLPEGLSGSFRIYIALVVAVITHCPGVCECLHVKPQFRASSFKIQTCFET